MVNVHIDPSLSMGDTKSHLDKSFSTANSPLATTFVAGDFNFPDEAEGRFHPRRDMRTYGHKALARWFGDKYSHFTELFQSEFTHSTIVDDEIGILSRIDRAFTDMQQLDVADCNPSAGVWGSIWKRSPLSDHIPLSFTLHCHAKRAPDRKIIPLWMLKKPEFEQQFQQLYNEYEADLISMTPEATILTIKDMAHAAAFATKAMLCRIGATTTLEKAYWVTKWL